MAAEEMGGGGPSVEGQTRGVPMTEDERQREYERFAQWWADNLAAELEEPEYDESDPSEEEFDRAKFERMRRKQKGMGDNSSSSEVESDRMRRKQEGKQAMGSPDSSLDTSSSSELNYSDIEVTNANTTCTLYANDSYIVHKEEGLLHGVVDKVEKARKERRAEREGRLGRVRKCVVVTEKGTQTEIEFSAEKDSFGEYMCLDTNLGEEDVLMDGRKSRENVQVPAGASDFDPVRLEHSSSCNTNDPIVTEEPIVLKSPEEGLVPKHTEYGTSEPSIVSDKFEREAMERYKKQILLNASLLKMDEGMQGLMMQIVIMESAPEGFVGVYTILDRKAVLLRTFEAWKVAVNTKKESLGTQLKEWNEAMEKMMRVNRSPLSEKEIANTVSFLQQVYDEHYGSSSAVQPSQEVPNVAPLSFPEAINLLTTAVADPMKTPSALDLKTTRKIMAQLSTIEDEPSPSTRRQRCRELRDYLNALVGVPDYLGNLHEELLFLGERRLEMSGKFLFQVSFPLLLRKWQPGIVINEEPTTIPCWIRLQGIPLELWHKGSVHYLPSSVGQLLKTDTRSFSPANMGTPRVQVECLAKDGLSKTIKAIDSRGNPLTISIVYEIRALCCKGCGVFGHDDGKCARGDAAVGKGKEIKAGNFEGNGNNKRQQDKRIRTKPIGAMDLREKAVQVEVKPLKTMTGGGEGAPAGVEQDDDLEGSFHESVIGEPNSATDEDECVSESAIQQ
ncbi:hypothetical protein MLD38_019790 [Melastoma candidum]|uniref:Uncharacterized protein n=1 Tax=Melastoma candidum TaxID=119954 RepID=A0ACB9QZ82_9MYRT|nr:hypothetical protein MLD38_019790 [Melastoma candidum]